MNRLVIVGNGFDLAHGLPTGYCDFIDDYWSKVFGKINDENVFELDYDDDLVNLNVNLRNLSSIQAVKDFRSIKNYVDFDSFLNNLNVNYVNNLYSITFYNSFFETINDNYLRNWVDIENEYYKELKVCLKDENDNSRVKKLNEEFEQVKGLLESYLQNQVVAKYNFSYITDIEQTVNIFDLNDRIKNRNSFLLEFGSKDQDHLVQYLNKKEYSLSVFDKNEELNLFLNFNYTSTVNIYCEAINKKWKNNHGKCEIIEIHGKLNDFENPINFGFGDEMDDDYKKIENKDDNEYLKNIKSFQYFQNSNYRKMLDFIDSGNFQVYIMGHSCGLSDRILLNKIFEHDKCRSIKVFYHQFDKPKNDGRTDNYTEIVQNISRHFNKKEMMREKIVNKSLCKPLPQIKLPLKENGSQ